MAGPGIIPLVQTAKRLQIVLYLLSTPYNRPVSPRRYSTMVRTGRHKLLGIMAFCDGMQVGGRLLTESKPTTGRSRTKLWLRCGTFPKLKICNRFGKMEKFSLRTIPGAPTPILIILRESSDCHNLPVDTI